jgi:NADPH-dependent 2,4-dienoyl-CoA reductase/sulfur reductase-like enzyme/rhodanese-related sulfurtransferase
MPKKVVIVGAVALGPKAAARIKRKNPEIEVTLIDADNYISYAGCGIPYYVSSDVQELEGLYSTFAHVVRDETYFKNVKGVTLRTRTEALAVNRKEKTLRVKHLPGGGEESLAYDNLVLATGAKPFIPPIPGVDLPGVTAATNLHQAKYIREQVAAGKVGKAVVVGGGAIGLEMAEALADLWGVETILVEMMDQLVPVSFDADMARLIQIHMEQKGVDIRLSDRVTRILGDPESGVRAVETTGAGEIPCDLVVMAVGVRPNADLAKAAGLAVGRFGGVLVDRRMRTSDPDIYAGGDCVEVPHLVGGGFVPMGLGSLANRQGRVIGTNIAGGEATFPGTVGNFCLKVFDFGIAAAGLTAAQAKAAGFDPVHAVVVQADRAHFYPTMELMHMKLIADRKTRRVLGVQAVGVAGDAVKSRVDSVAVLLGRGADVEAISGLEVGYAPPYASAMDIVNNAGNALENILDGYQVPLDACDFLKAFKENGLTVLDVRSPVQAEPYVDKYPGKWLNIEQGELHRRLDEVPREPLVLVCGSGPRSYETQLLLRHRDINRDTQNIQGGIGMIIYTDPDFAPEK